MFKIQTLDGQIRSGVKGSYAGHKKLKIFGRLSCKSGSRMKNDNRVFFHSMEEAIKLGYRPCKNCRPMNQLDFEYYRSIIQYDSLEHFYDRDNKLK